MGCLVLIFVFKSGGNAALCAGTVDRVLRVGAVERHERGSASACF